MISELYIFFIYLKIISLILCVLFLIGVIYYFKKLKILSKWKEKWQDWWGIVPEISSSNKNRKEWNKVYALLLEPYESSWKLAVIKAEAIVKETLNLMGYSGFGAADQKQDDFTRILEELKLRNYQNLETLHQLHQVRQKIIEDKDFSLEQNKAKEIVDIYKKFWEELLNI
jgi:hypothetical protein